MPVPLGKDLFSFRAKRVLSFSIYKAYDDYKLNEV